MIILIYIYVFIFGLLVGSFTNVLIYRIPRNESIVFPPSHCPHCGKKIKWYDNIPIISYIILGGKCRYCKAKISLQYPIIELISGLIYVLLFYKLQLSIEFILFVFLTPILLSMFYIDVKTHYIYDIETIVVFIFFILYFIIKYFVYHVLLWENLISGVLSLIIFGVIFFIAKIIYKKEGFGLGDVFLGSILALFFSYKLFLVYFLLTTILGSIIGGIIFLVRKKRDVAFAPFLIVSLYLIMLFPNFFKKIAELIIPI